MKILVVLAHPYMYYSRVNKVFMNEVLKDEDIEKSAKEYVEHIKRVF